ncbi:MAG TPA: winged helix-turn-helix transcriptional regulator [Solirubrobacterales bacterium]|jgi:transposase-like protein|nr:winged helix-turn-helix transcriptional regulator [Solirubrobacterales bacterium]
MPSTSKVLDEALDLVKKRLAELDEERKRLERALAELGGTITHRRPGRPPGSGKKRGPGRPRKTATASTSTAAPRRRRRRGGTRADQAVALVEQNPGISASAIAKQLKIKPNYLYRVLGEMEKEGRVKKKGREYHPAG